MTDDRTRWNRRYREDPPSETPAAIVREHADDLPRGTALDVACGGGRNAIFLAERGFDVTAIDVSDERSESEAESSSAATVSRTWRSITLADGPTKRASTSTSCGTT